MKSRGHFHFKQFSIAHDRCSHKIGTDGVLLGAWVDTKGSKSILDIGTGSGVIALMLAQRTDDQTQIDAIDIEKEDTEQAVENVLQSPWPNKISVHHISVQKFSMIDNKYDLIVSNPPYFINSWQPPEHKRSQARHTQQLPFDELLRSSTRMLKEDGRLGVILPHQEALHFIELAQGNGLYAIRKLEFRSRPHKPVERLLIEFSFRKHQLISETLILHPATSNDWSADYINLTREFYL